jgi:hypothetical protein
VSETPCLVRTWAKRGKTPIVTHPFNWKRLSALVLVTHTGRVLRETIAGAYDAGTFLAALQRLLAKIEGKIVLPLDGAPIHRTRAVTRWLDSPEAKERIEWHRLPAYAPGLNPVELGNSAAERGLLGNFVAEDLGRLAARFDQAFDLPADTVKGFFRGALGTDFSVCQART